jgi:hypothetical protein
MLDGGMMEVSHVMASPEWLIYKADERE